ncbi:MAG TPA: bifunctional metallophosphatase/5'-nucleotidase [Gemmatimonadales bacterium]|nr:bifunctional metallophosphatase/5'-nucleotidase [Gemmatimonadales bacterium]
MIGHALRRSAAALALGSLTACLAGLPPPPAPTNPIRLLSINDVYVADTLADGSGGLARVAALRDRIASEGPTLFVLAGDFLSPSLLSKYYHGRHMVDALNAARLDYATFGNHEFEVPRDTLVARIAESRFRWLSANCTEAGGGSIPGVLPWDTVRLAERKVGLFGLTMRGDYPGYVQCADPDSVARSVIDTLAAQGAELVVAITHQPIEDDRRLLNRETRLDLVLGGHEHEAQTLEVSGRHILKADANARTAQFATVWGAKGHWRQAVALLPVHAGLPMDSATAVVVAGWQDSLRARLGPERRLGTLPAPLDARDALQRRAETGLGNVVTDAIRAGTGVDVALLNAGALRYDDVLPAGPLTSYQVESVFLFPDETRMLVARMTGARLRELLERSVSDGVIGKGGFLQVSGVRFSYDAAQPSGQRVTGDLRRPDGTAIGAGDALLVALPGFLACAAGDGYRVPEAAEACRGLPAAPRAVDLLMRYAMDSLRGTLVAPALGRITVR